MFLSTLDASIVNIALPTISDFFKASVQTTAWVTISYLLVITALLLVFGRLSDVYGQKLVFMTGLLIFTAGSGICAIAGNIAELIIFRSIQGIGAAMIVSNTAAIVTNAFPPEQRGTGLGVIGAVVSIGLMTGPPLGGLLIHYLDWHYIFLVNVPFGIAAIVLTLRILPERKADPDSRAFHPLDSILWIAGITSIILTFGIIGHLNPAALSLFAYSMVSVVLMGVFFMRQARSASPLFNTMFLRNDVFLFASIAALFANMAMIALTFMLPFYMQHSLGMSALEVGKILVIVPLTTAFASPLSGFLSDKLGQRPVASIGSIITAAAIASMLKLSQNSSSIDVISRLVFFGVGLGMFGTPNNSALMGSVENKDRGSAGGLLGTVRNLGMVSGLGVASIIFNSGLKRWPGAEAMSYSKAFTGALPVIVGFAILALVFSALRKSV